MSWLTFVIVGGGPTGVELAGALAELAHATLRGEFRHYCPTQSKIILVEAGPRILPSFPEDLGKRAILALKKLGVEIKVNAYASHISPEEVILQTPEGEKKIPARTILWAAGIAPSPWGRILQQRLGATLHSSGRVVVERDLSLPPAREIFVIGDLAYYEDAKGLPLPALAPVAMQQGKHTARVILSRIRNKSTMPFTYRNKGELAVIGRNSAVANFGRLRFSGFLAWLVWAFVHIGYLIEFDNKVLVFFQWAWNYFTRNRGARLIGRDDV
jgi:NADH dehydrogenase